MTLREMAAFQLELQKAAYTDRQYAIQHIYPAIAPEVQDVSQQLGKLLFHCSQAQWADMKRLISGRLGFNCSDLTLTAIILWTRVGKRPPTTVVEENAWLYIYETA